MLDNRNRVLKLREEFREKSRQFFIPLGGFDDKTAAKREISNLTTTLYNHLPLVKAITDAAKGMPVYVGYDGQQPETRSGTYTRNLILLHEAADESSLSFIHAYSHELVHLDQDRRGLLREDDAVPPPEQFVSYLAHNLMLEAAAYATEAVSLYYISEWSKLRDVDDEIEDYFDQYAAEITSNIYLRTIIEDAVAEGKGRQFNRLKPAWQAVFQHFFAPDSDHAANYIRQFSKVYLNRAQNNKIDWQAAPRWGGLKELEDITTMPGWGAVFPKAALPVLLRQINAGITQEKHLATIDVVRGYVAAQMPMEHKVLKLFQGMDP